MKLSVAFGVVLVLAAGVYPAGQAVETLRYDHVHLAVADPIADAAWYRKYLGATESERPDRVLFGTTRFSFLKNDKAERSDGSAIDHVGLSYTDLGAKLKELEGSGMKLLQAPRAIEGLFTLAFIEDPWGVKLELVDDRETLGFHHIHLRVSDPTATLKWFSDMFGGQPAKMGGRLDGLKYGTVWLLAQRGENSPRSQGHAIDHIGWRARELRPKVTELKAKGATVTLEPRVNPIDQIGEISMLENPSGVRVEVSDRPGP